MRERAIGIVPIIEVAPRIDVLTQVFCVRTFSIRRKDIGIQTMASLDDVI